MSTAEPKPAKGMRTGYTTGACAAAAAKAATRCLVRDTLLTEIETTLPNRSRVTFPLKRCERLGSRAVCSVIKDAGDDPDCTNGAELVAEVELRPEAGHRDPGGPGDRPRDQARAGPGGRGTGHHADPATQPHRDGGRGAGR